MPRERAVLVALVLLVTGVVFTLDLAICPTAGILGIPCPSCGLTRAALALAAGDWRRANATHPGVWPVLTYLGLVGIGWKKWQNSPSLSRLAGWLGIALVLGLTLIWAARFWGWFGGPVSVQPWRP